MKKHPEKVAKKAVQSIEKRHERRRAEHPTVVGMTLVYAELAEMRVSVGLRFPASDRRLLQSHEAEVRDLFSSLKGWEIAAIRLPLHHQETRIQHKGANSEVVVVLVPMSRR